MRLLFICNQNKNRSKTAVDLLKGKYEVKSAGFYCEDTAESKLVTRDMLAWADTIYIFEQMHVDEIRERFPGEYLSKRIVNLDIPDIYLRGDAELKRLILKKMENKIKK